jgi:hypothetical protein
MLRAALAVGRRTFSTATTSVARVPLREKAVSDWVTAIEQQQAERSQSALSPSSRPLHLLADGMGASELLERLHQNGQADLGWKVYGRLRELSHDGLSSKDYVHFLGFFGNFKRRYLALRAMAVEADMRRAGAYDESDENLVVALIRARAHYDDFEGSCAVFERASAAAAERGKRPSDRVLLAFLGACAYTAEAELALQVHTEYIAPRSHTRRASAASHQAYNAATLEKSLGFVMNAHARRGEVGAAAELLGGAVREGMALRAMHLNALLLACVNRGHAHGQGTHWQGPRRALGSTDGWLATQGVSSNSGTEEELLEEEEELQRVDGKRRGERTTEMVEGDEQLDAMPAVPQPAALDTRDDCPTGQDAMAIFREHVRAAVASSEPPPVDRLTYALLLKACVLSGDADDAIETRRRAAEADLPLGRESDYALIRCLLAGGRPGDAYSLYEESRDAHGVPNLQLIAQLTEGCYAASHDAFDDEERALWMERSLVLYADGQQLIKQRGKMRGGSGRAQAGEKPPDVDEARGAGNLGPGSRGGASHEGGAPPPQSLLQRAASLDEAARKLQGRLDERQTRRGGTATRGAGPWSSRPSRSPRH